jgi:anti-sigma-K factor RskA
MSACEHRENVAAYLLGALSEAEHEAFAAHLPGCEDCRREIAHLQLAADALPLAAVQVVPPPELKDRIMAVVRSEAQLQAAAEGERERAPRSTRRRRRPSGFPALRPVPLAAAAAVIVAIAVAVGVLLSSGGAGTKTIRAQVMLPSAPAARASLVLSDNATKLRLRDMPPPPSGKVYEVWLKRPARPPAPSVLFRVGAGGSADVKIQGSRLKGVDQVLVTAEPNGGSKAPTSNPIIVAATA